MCSNTIDPGWPQYILYGAQSDQNQLLWDYLIRQTKVRQTNVDHKKYKT